MTDGYKIKRILVWQNGEEKQIYPDTRWKPNANTVAYYPFNGDINDYSGNSRNLSVYTGTVQYGDLTGGKFLQFTGQQILTTSNIQLLNSGTLLMWSNILSGGIPFSVNQDTNNSSNYTNHSQIFSNKQGIWALYEETSGGYSFSGDFSSNNWRLYTITSDGSTLSYYNNGQLKATFSTSRFLNKTSANQWSVGALKRGTQTYNLSTGGLSNLIIENKVWTAQEVSEYYNLTKSKYGL